MNAPPAAPGPAPAAPGIERYCAPRTVEEAAEALAGGGATVIAGGTDLMVDPHGPWAGQATLVNIQRIAAMRGIAESDGKIRIGALTTVTDILDSAVLARRAPVLPATADRFASVQIRNMASLGGNIANASPAGDMIIPLLLLDAEIELVAWRDGALQTRSAPLDGLFEGPGRARIAADELIVAIVFAVPDKGFTARFEKSGPRPALEIAVVSAGLGGIRVGNKLAGVRVAFGAVAPTPIRARKTEAALEGRPLDDPATLAAAIEAAEAETAPISDLRGSDWYRRHLIRAYLESMVTDVVQN